MLNNQIRLYKPVKSKEPHVFALLWQTLKFHKYVKCLVNACWEVHKFKENLRGQDQYGLSSRICNHWLRSWSPAQRNLRWHLTLSFPASDKVGYLQVSGSLLAAQSKRTVDDTHPPKRSRHSSLWLLRGVRCVPEASSSLLQIFFSHTQGTKEDRK